MSLDISKYEQIFVRETTQYLGALEILLGAAGQDPANGDLWRDAYGKLHSIKGMARALELDAITGLAHAMENWCRLFAEETACADKASLDLLVEGLELIGRQVERRIDLGDAPHRERLETLVAAFSAPPQAPSVSPPRPGGTPERDAPPLKPPAIEWLSVPFGLVEGLMGLSQEVLQAGAALRQTEAMGASVAPAADLGNLLYLIRELYLALARMRLISVREYGALFEKVVRSLGRETGRGVALEVRGGTLQADAALLDRLREPLLHLMRNAVIHGIEPGDERERLGKPREGRIVLEVQREGERLVLTVGDDGRGIDEARVHAYLKAKKGLNEEEIGRLSPSALCATILEPGFSGAAQLTEFAGRGMGLHVVAQAVEYLSGSLRIRSRPFQGTQFVIGLPLALAVAYCLVFRIGPYWLALPSSDVQRIEGRSGLAAEDVSMVLMDLARSGEPSARAAYVVVLRGAQRGVALPSDSIKGIQPVTVMPAGGLLGQARRFAGVGLLEDGQICVVMQREILDAGGTGAGGR